ncbi:delta-aminolevulinic acid dehydratase domain-containing protein [Theileria equi strain WA]|uniref:porphobilinogen synthase n=1 Tax=Theileria equi strain WA TaxID=1537102 RepID=L0B0Q6_THEEQ|nr:delta-aminolevulinic acid dehydratase domain-containing protein [Theileria equi strain WA]AFZ81422.1 delta-aminolevulinic acid dehydratase domain-containing protein [Theileria equi strain WA]|eukprot:XP_004831088.1 delta-aminolevulinic acid dehydratase domain-containing protein [Theileria equi strain WA]
MGPFLRSKLVSIALFGIIYSGITVFLSSSQVFAIVLRSSGNGSTFSKVGPSTGIIQTSCFIAAPLGSNTEYASRDPKQYLGKDPVAKEDYTICFARKKKEVMYLRVFVLYMSILSPEVPIESEDIIEAEELNYDPDEVYDEYDDYDDEVEGDDGYDGDEDEDYTDSEDIDDDSGDSFDYNSRGELMIPGIHRFSRTRSSRGRRKLFKQDFVHISNIVYPIVVHDNDTSELPSVQGMRVFSVEDAVKEVSEAKQLGITTFMLYPYVDQALKTQFGDEGLNKDGILPRAIAAIKEAVPSVQIIADTSVSYYTTDGHDGLVEPETNTISNDITVGQIAKQASILASAGSDIVSLNDLMDGSVAITREMLDYDGFTDVSIMSRASKFKSAWNNGNKAFGVSPSQKVDSSSYLHNVSNSQDGVLKAVNDIESGSDLISVEPATPFLDVLKELSEKVKVPIVAIHTTGEYKAIKAAAKAGVYDEKEAAIEAIKSLKRAGSDLIVTPYAKELALWLLNDMRNNGVDREDRHLETNPDLYTGVLENGLTYTILPNEHHGGRFEAYLQVHSGSADELDHQRGVAHFCEHVTYMGSRKRDKLIGKDVRTNAFTDFHHTVFYTSCPSIMEDTEFKTESLNKALSTLLDVVEAPTQFNSSRVEKERMAILSEASIINTMEYRKNCATVKALHSENILSKRYPIGDLEMLKKYTVEDLSSYHKVHYRPSNLHLFIVGDVDVAVAKASIYEIFSKLQNSPVEISYEGTVKETRRSLPPAKHDWNQPGPKISIWENEQLNNFALEIVKKLPIPECKTWRDLRNNILNKIVYRALTLNFDIIGRGTFYDSVETNDFDCINEGCRIRSLEVKSALDQWEKSVSAVISQAKSFASEGITEHLFKIVTDSLKLDISRLDNKVDNQELITRIMDDYACGRTLMNKKYEKEAIQDCIEDLHIDDVNSLLCELLKWTNGKDLDGMNLICSAPPKGKSPGFQGITQEKLSNVFYEACTSSPIAFSTGIEVPSQLLLPSEKKEIMDKVPAPTFLKQDLIKEQMYIFEDLKVDSSALKDTDEKVVNPSQTVSDTFIDTIKSTDLENIIKSYTEQLRESMELQTEVEYIKPKIDETERTRLETLLLDRSIGLPGTKDGPYIHGLSELNKPIASIGDPNARLYTGTKPSSQSIDLYTLSNGIHVNVKTLDPTTEVPTHSIRTLIPLDYKVKDTEEIKRKKTHLLVAAASMMEGGAMGQLSRFQVEMFCSRHLIDVNISMNEDFFIIEMSFPYKNQNSSSNVDTLESALQILHYLLRYHKIEPDAFQRGVDRIKRDRMQYVQDLQSFGTGDILNSMSQGKLSFHYLDTNVLDKITLEDVQRELSDAFKRGKPEVSFCGNFESNHLNSLVGTYLGTIETSNVDCNKEYILAEAFFASTAEPKEAENPTSVTPIVETHVTGLETSLRNGLIYVPDNQERAMVLVAGHAPNSCGILPDGTHITYILERTLLQILGDDDKNIRTMAKVRRELWSHPAFPKVASLLFQEMLNNRTFSILRSEKHLTYESNVEFIPYDIQFAGYFIISVHSSFSTSEAILKETKQILRDICTGYRPLTEYNLKRAKDQVRSKLQKESKNTHFWTKRMGGLQIMEMPFNSSIAITEFDKVVQRITFDDINLLITSHVYGFNEENLWTRIIRTKSP